jgi:hypothetical protein
MAVMASRFTPAPPSSISGCKLYLNGDLGVTVATGVSNWADQSGNGNDVSQGTGANQPAQVTNWRNGKNAIQGASGKSLLRTTFASGTISQPITFLCVGSWSNSALTFFADGSGAGNRIGVGVTGGGLWSMTHSSLSFGVGSSQSADTPFVSTSTFDSPESSSCSAVVYPNGSAVQSGTFDPDGAENSLTGITVGASYIPSNNWDGKIATLSIFARVLNGSELAMVSTWAKAYYAITTA